MDGEASKQRSAAMHRAGADAWPQLALPQSTFADYLEARDDPAEPLAEDLYLACACEQGIGGAVDAFERRYVGLYRKVFDRMGLSAVADDLAQQLLENLFTKGAIANYRGKGALGKWVQVVAARVGHRHLKREPESRRRELDDAQLEGALGDHEPELMRLKEAYRAQFKAAFATAFAELTDRERNLFRLQYVDGLNLESMAALYNVSRATVARWRTSSRTRLKELTHQALRQTLELQTATDMDSILRLIDSDLEVSLTRLLRRDS